MTATARPPGSVGSAAGGFRSTASRPFWDAVRALVGSRLDDVDALTTHGLGPLAADELARRGVPIPPLLQRQQHRARIAALTAPALLDRVRSACVGPAMVLKGPEVASRYPNGSRTFGDIDLLVPDAPRAQRELVAAGFVEEDDPDGRWVGIHHLPRLRYPGAPLGVEVHSEPKWLDGVQPPPTEELFEAAVPSVVGVRDVLAPSAPHHAILLAAHAWAHQPLGKARDLIDVGAFSSSLERSELERVAEAWGLGRLWRTTTLSLDAFLGAGRSWPLRLWAAHLAEFRSQTVLEAHLERLLAPLWGYPPVPAARRVGTALAAEVRPAFDEGWGEKARRMARALRTPFAPITEHRRRLGDSATRGQRRNPPPEVDPYASTRSSGPPEAS